MTRNMHHPMKLASQFTRRSSQTGEQPVQARQLEALTASRRHELFSEDAAAALVGVRRPLRNAAFVVHYARLVAELAAIPFS